MKAVINNTLISQTKPKEKEVDIWDTKLRGFILRVLPSGRMIYRCEYSRGKRLTIGDTTLFTPAQARDKALEILAAAARGEINTFIKKGIEEITLKEFIDKDYGAWHVSNRRRGKKSLALLQNHFFQFLKTPLKDIKQVSVEKWRTMRLNAGKKPSTVNRDINRLRALLSKAVEWDVIEENPLGKLKQFKVDHFSIVRFLSNDEEKRLREALNSREKSFSTLKSDTAKKNMSEHVIDFSKKHFVDYLYPMVILTLNTGMRLGEVFNLKWKSIEFSLSMLTVESDTSKNGKSRHIPLNEEALDVLKKWRLQANTNEYVFSGKNGTPMTDIRKSWKNLLKVAGIEKFRWHDMRHHFASQLVMLGVDLNTVRELLGHSTLTMTLRYAHLAPEHKTKAVAKLVKQ